MEILERALEPERAGMRVLHLELGEPDFAPPREVITASGPARAESPQ